MIGDQHLYRRTIIPEELYVERRADRQLSQVLKHMDQPAQVLVARQMGKTNLLNNAIRSADPRDLYVYVDLTNSPSNLRHLFRFVINIAAKQCQAKGMPLLAELESSRENTGKLQPDQEHEIELLFILGRITGCLVLCLDEIDALSGFHDADRFFGFVRSTFFSRISNPEFHRLNYVLAGVMEPIEIITRSDISPFNIAKSIELDDFSLEQAQELLDKANLNWPTQILRRVYHYTQGHPRMTWEVCSELEERSLEYKCLSVFDVDSVVENCYFSGSSLPPIDGMQRQLELDEDLRFAALEMLEGRSDNLSARLKRRLYLAGLVPAPFRRAKQLKNLVVERIVATQRQGLLQGQPNNLPLASLGSLFKGREQFLRGLHQHLNQSAQGTTAITDKANPQRVRAFHGYGGIGKTRAAIEYAWRHADEYAALLFLSAETPDSLDSNLAGLADVVSNTDLAGATDEQRIYKTLVWLQNNSGWLLIVDNVDTDEAAVAIKARLPQLTQGHVLITSRLAQWGAAVETMDLGVLELDDSKNYLLEATEANRTHGVQDDKHAREIAIKAGQLPLGLEHAAAWINAQYKGFEDYLSQWERDESDILEEFDRNQISYPHELLVTWKLSVDRLDEEARHLLEVLSWLSPEIVPDTFFQAAPNESHKTARKAIASLVKYSLASRAQQDEQSGFQVHRLVQATTRYHQLQTAGGEVPALDKALAWIDEAYQGTPSDIRNWPALEPLAEHVDTVCEFGFEHHKTGKDQPTSRLLNDLAQLYDEKARYAAAEPLMRRALQIDEHSYGEDHPRVAVQLNNLASLLQATNRLSEAEPLMRRALQINQHSYGGDHPDVATNLNNLAQLLKAMNRLSEAEPLMRRALQIDEHSYGEDHPDVAIRLNNLASLLQATNRLSEAEPLMRRALQIDEHSFGEDHPDVARDLNSLASLLQATSRLSEAEPLMRRALQIDEHSYGEDHPRVAVQLNNLASLLQATNRLSEAEPLMRRTLQIDTHSYGEDHPDVARDLNNLAFLLQATNRLSEAEPLMRRAMQIDEHSFGEDHPRVAVQLNNLASLLQATNRLSEAEPLMRRALQIDEHSFGENHPKVAIRLNNLAQLLQNTNRLSEAEPLMRRVVEIFHGFGKATGHEHPHMEAATNNYKSLLLETGLSPEKALTSVHDIIS